MAARRRTPVILVPALAITLVLASLVLIAPPVRAGAAIVFQEGFEAGVLGPRWSANDTNPLGGQDYWGVTKYRAHNGNYSAWCAQVGNQSSGAYTGQNNSDVHEYDDEMQADLVIDLQVNGFTSLTLSFYYFVKTENGGGDWIQAWYEAGGVQTNLFNPRGSSGGGWNPVNVSVPNNVERLIIRFHSDSANHGFEGAYVDDIVITGIEDVPPTSNVLPLPTYSNAAPTLIPFRAVDNANASGVAYVELWYRQGTTGPFTKYTPDQNRLGRFILTPISFDPQAALGDGYYEFYTVAVDYAGNIESAPGTPDANITIDTTPPTLTVNAPSDGALLATGNVTVAWQASDTLSGVVDYEARLDAGAFSSNGLSGQRSFSGLTDGVHAVAVRAYDAAGNMAEIQVRFTVDTTAPTLTISAPGPDEYVHSDGYLFQWTSFDATSGIDRFEVGLEGGTIFIVTEPRLVLEALPEGWHTFRVTAYDRAGNQATAEVRFLVDRNPFSFTGPYGGLPLFLLLAILIGLMIFLLLWWRHRKEREDSHRTLGAVVAPAADQSGDRPPTNGAGVQPPEAPKGP